MTQTLPQFYSRAGLHVEIYDVQTEAGWTAIHDDVRFYVEEAIAAEGRVLELACGTGRILLPLVRAGAEAHGLDVNATMCNVIERKRQNLSPTQARKLHVHAGDMKDFHLKESFALVIVAFRSFQALLTPDEQRSCLAAIHRHLTDNGRVILNLFDPRYDLIAPEYVERMRETREVTNPATGHCVSVEVLSRVNEPLSQTFVERWRFCETDADGTVLRMEEEELRLRWTFRQEMRHLAELCGFEIENEYSDFHRSSPAYGKEQIWVLKKK